MARRRSAWRTRLIADGVRAPVQPRGVLAKFEDLYSANADRQAAGKWPTGATVDGIRVPHMRADAISEPPRSCGQTVSDIVADGAPKLEMRHDLPKQMVLLTWRRRQGA